MAGIKFEIVGERVDSQEEFAGRESDNCWKNLLYFPEFFGSRGRHPLVFNAKTFDNISFKDTDLVRGRFIRCKFVNCLFIGALFKDCEFIDCKFQSTNTSKLKISGTLIDPMAFDGNFDLLGDTNIAIGLYQALYKNSLEQHQPEYAIASLYSMKQAENAHLNSQKVRGVIKPREYWQRRIWNNIYDYISGYGMRPLRVVRFLLIVLGIFSLSNFLFSLQIVGEDLSLIDAIYFSVVTVTTLGYGDILPVTQIGRLVITAQVLIGFSVISLYIAAVISLALRTK